MIPRFLRWLTGRSARRLDVAAAFLIGMIGGTPGLPWWAMFVIVGGGIAVTDLLGWLLSLCLRRMARKC
jgi:hypothetical protein